MASGEGDTFALPASTPVGVTCLALFTGGNDDGLAERLSEEFDDVGRAEVVALFRRRAGEPFVLPQEQGSVVDARDRGFVPLAEHTGVGDALGPLWPPRHRISRVDLGESGDDPDDLWLVRSPWEALSLADVISVLWRWVDRDPYPDDVGEWRTRVSEVFAKTESEARRLLQR